MTDEQKRIVERLRDTWCYFYRPSSRGYNDDMQVSPDIIADVIEYMGNEIDELCAENERIRQTHVPYEVYLEMVGVMAKERTEWKRKAEAMEHDLSLSRCMSCIHEQTEPCLESCVVCFDGGKYKWRGVCVENGGK